MAKQMGPITIRGTIGNITFYKLYDDYYARKKSSLSAKRVKTDPCFANTMRNAKWFGEAVDLAKHVYYGISKDDRKGLWHPIRNMAQRLIREGVPVPNIIWLLTKEFNPALIENLTDKTVRPVTRITYSDINKKSVEQKLIDQLVAANIFIRSITDRVELII